MVISLKSLKLRKSLKAKDKSFSEKLRKVILPKKKKLSPEEKQHTKYLKEKLRQMKLQIQIRKQFESEQLAMQQDPRFQHSAEKAWVEGEDMEHLADIERYKQQQALSRLQDDIPRRNILSNVSSRGKELLQKFSIVRGGAPPIRSSPPNLLSRQERNIMNQEPEMMSSVRRSGEMFGRARITLMGSENQPKAHRLNFTSQQDMPRIIRPLNMPIQESKFDENKLRWL